jgi:hypothetical protein
VVGCKAGQAMLKPLAAALCALLALADCTMDAGYGSSRATPVLDGALNVGVPAGYCIDQKTSRAGKDTAVVLMGRCTDVVKAKPALITVSIGKTASAGVLTAGGPALAQFFTSAQGRSMLSRSGRAGDVKVIQAVGVGDAFLLHLNDRAVGEYWRAVVGVNGRLVTISATGTEAMPLPPADSRALIDASLKALRTANPGGS